MAVKLFNGASGILNAAKNFLPLNLGVNKGNLNSKNEKYIVSIDTTEPESHIYAFLQEKFVFNVSSEWTDSGVVGGIPAIANDISQILTGQTLLNTLTTRRKWRGSSPVSLQVKLRFEAFEDVKKEVILPCYKLQALTLPDGAKTEHGEWFLRPPGPNPFWMPQLNASTAGFERFGKGDAISITIGGFIKFVSVVVSSVEITYESRMSKDGPVGAEAVVNFQTYEMLTKDSLLESYYKVTKEERNESNITEEQKAKVT